LGTKYNKAIISGHIKHHRMENISWKARVFLMANIRDMSLYFWVNTYWTLYVNCPIPFLSFLFQYLQPSADKTNNNYPYNLQSATLFLRLKTKKTRNATTFSLKSRKSILNVCSSVNFLKMVFESILIRNKLFPIDLGRRLQK